MSCRCSTSPTRAPSSAPARWSGRRRTRKELDYELEVAAVIARDCEDVDADDWLSVVAGFTIMNDWSARDLQRREMALGLGPAKGKDFATSLGTVPRHPGGAARR